MPEEYSDNSRNIGIAPGGASPNKDVELVKETSELVSEEREKRDTDIPSMRDDPEKPTQLPGSEVRLAMTAAFEDADVQHSI